MNIPEVAQLDVSRFRLREATERLNHQEYDLVRELRAGSEPAFHNHLDQLDKSQSASCRLRYLQSVETSLQRLFAIGQ
jgi:hypothetical protein